MPLVPIPPVRYRCAAWRVHDPLPPDVANTIAWPLFLSGIGAVALSALPRYRDKQRGSLLALQGDGGRADCHPSRHSGTACPVWWWRCCSSDGHDSERLQT